MQFLVVSQRAISTPHFSLKDLTGHGRIDIIMRCILAACRKISNFNEEKNIIYCYLKGSTNIKTRGWITWNQEISNEDEISIAAKIKNNWAELFTLGPLRSILWKLNHPQLIYLHEEGESYENIANQISENCLIIIGAQADLINDDLKQLPIDMKLKLSNESMLASQVITLYRQKMLIR